MADHNNEGIDNNSDSPKDSGLDKSFVGKFVSGLLNNTPLSKWFGKETSSKSVVRRRDDDDDDEDASFVFQPPVKRAKLPTNTEHNNYSAHLFESPVTVHASNNVNNVSSRVFGKFPEPVAGPSGIKSRKLFELHNSTASTNTVSNSFENSNVVNGENGSDSEESTSGYSSAPRLVNKEKAVENANTINSTETCETFIPKTRSLFATSNSSNSRTLFNERSPQMNTSLSSRRPTFNSSTFGSPNFVDRTLSTKKILNSPFYNGHTIYGGASAYGRRLGRSAEDLNSSTRVSVQIKPVNEKMTNDNTALSKTARRILSTLEQYSTAISDAKKIPVTPKKEGILSKYIGATPYSVRDRKRPSNKELQVPTVPELLQMKQKQKLQNSTVSVRQIATSSKSTLNKEEYKLRTEDDNKHKHSNKIKSSLSSLRQKPQSVEPLAEVKLPKVSLPITTLPKFDFVMMPPQNSSETSKNSPKTMKSAVTTESKSTSTILEKKEVDKKSIENGKTIFTFSEPLIISKDLKAVAAINSFKFSEPLCKKQCVDVGMSLKPVETNMSNNVGGFKLKNNGENVKPTCQLLTNSADTLGKKDDTLVVRNTPQVELTSWECQTCLVINNADKVKCVACHELKPDTDSKKGFGDQFKLTSDKWECDSCLVRNSNSDSQCVACGTTKPGSEKSTLKSTSECIDCSSSRDIFKLDKKSFGDKFKPPSNTWECNVCMIRNKNDLNKCEACQTPKPGFKPTQKTVTFKLPSDIWECPTCMIRNKNDELKCPACQTLKPGEKNMPTVGTNTFTFGIAPVEWECKTCSVKNKNDLQKCVSCGALKAKDQEKEGFGDVFKKKEGEWDCTSCLVRNKSGSDICTCCGVSKPGSDSEKLSQIGKDDKKPVISFNFGIDKSSPASFKFGIPSAKSETKENTSVASTTVPVPTVTSTPVLTLPSVTTVTQTSTSAIIAAPTTTSTPTPVPTLIFGDAAKSTTTTSSTFTFGISTQEKITPMKSITSISETVTSSIGSNNPLLKPTEKLPEKAIPAPVGFKFGLDTSNNLNQKAVSSETSVNSLSKSETPVVFSSNFEPVKSTIQTPTFQFKPTTINGDVGKSKDSPFSSKPTQSTNLFMSKPAENNLFAKPAESTNLFTSKPVESSNLFTGNKPADSGNLFQTKAADTSNLFSNKPTEGTNLFTNKPAESNLFSNKSGESNNLFSNKPAETSNLFSSKPSENSSLFTSKPAESSNLFGSKPTENNLFSSKPADSNTLFSSKPAESNTLFSSKPAESNNLFSSKPAESTNLFGSKPAESSNLFSSKPTEGNNMFSNKPVESGSGLFVNKPAETNLFTNKPAEGSSSFPNTPLTLRFKFNAKPTETTTPTTSTVSQPDLNPPPIFKFGADTSQPVIPLKKAFGESNDNNASNGFGAVSKIPSFGSPQTFGATENKPFTFGNNDSTPKNTGFSFGQPQPEKAVAGPVFNFGSGTSSTPGSGFNFTSPSTGFNFGTVGKIESQPFGTPPNVFGTEAAGAKNGSFNFGTNTNNNNQKAIFTFGASQTNQPSFPTQNQPGFNFGVAAPPAIPTGGFNFTGAPPSFNFTDGTQPTGQPQRKIKKALRRTHR